MNMERLLLSLASNVEYRASLDFIYPSEKSLTDVSASLVSYNKAIFPCDKLFRRLVFEVLKFEPSSFSAAPPLEKEFEDESVKTNDFLAARFARNLLVMKSSKRHRRINPATAPTAMKTVPVGALERHTYGLSVAVGGVMVGVVHVVEAVPEMVGMLEREGIFVVLLLAMARSM